MDSLLKVFPKCSISIQVYEDGVEQPLLQGEVDLGFDCGKPDTPEILHRRITPETIAPVIAPRLSRKMKKKISLEDLIGIPHIFCNRLSPARIMDRGAPGFLNTIIRSNDIALTREICIQGFGWALLPVYCIRRELDSGALELIGAKTYTQEKYGVWILRNRQSHLSLAFRSACNWLESITLT